MVMTIRPELSSSPMRLRVRDMPYRIFTRGTTDADWRASFVIVDDDDEVQDITDLDFEFAVNDQWGIGLFTEDSTGVTVSKDEADNIVSIEVLASALNAQDEGNHQIACRYVDADDATVQVFIGTLQLQEGGFT